MAKKILLAHGSGGQLMHNLIRELILPKLSNPLLNKLADSAIIDFKDRPLTFPVTEASGKIESCRLED